jgi:hypothetical protein
MAPMQVRPADTGPPPADERELAELTASRRDTARSWLTAHRRTLALHGAAVLATVFVVRVVGSGFAAGYPPFFPDSSSFAAVARRGPFTGRFWFDERPVGFPLVFWAVGRSVRYLVLVQIALHVAAFGAVVAVALRTLRSRLAQVVVVAFTVAIAVQPRFALWTTHVLSESLAISTGVAAIAAWWWFATTPTRRRAVAALTVSLAWVLVRDSNAIVFAVSVIPVLAVAGWRRRRTDPAVGRTLLAGAVVGIAVCSYVTVSQDVADRTIYPVISNVGQRILPDADMTAWFEDRGMPLDDALRSHTGDSAFDDESALLLDPAFAGLRDWARGAGQRWQVLSYVWHFPFWSGLLGDRLDEVVGYDYEDYDAFDVGARIGSPGLDGPRSSTQLAIWLTVAGAGLVAAASCRRLRGRTVVVAVAIAGCLVDAYISFAGDSLEVQRHVVAALARLSIALVLAVGLGVERIATQRHAIAVADGPVEAPRQAGGPRRSLGVTVVALATTALATVVVLAAFFGNELRAQDYDPQFMKVLVDRVGALGVSYYEGALHNKGPFEPFVYRVAAMVTSDDGFWLAISAFVIVAAALCALAIATTARVAGTSGLLAVALGGGLFVHLTVTRADYSGVLYSRNITVAILAVAWTLVVWSGPWTGSARRRLLVVAALGVLLGLCVQTLVTAVFSAAVVGVLALVRMHRDHRPEWRRAAVVLAGTAALTVVAPIIWYLARGRFAEFWGGWWIYGSYQSSALGRSLFGQFGLAWDQAYEYYRNWPLSAVVVAAAVGLAVMRWPQLPAAQRAIRVGVAAWFVAAWIELAVAQRYSSHYFSILAVPTWLAAATALADLVALAPPRPDRPVRRAALPLLVALAVLFTSTEAELRTGIAAASEFSGVADLARERRRNESGAVRSTRATIDLASRPGDPLLAWTERPWTYLQWHRIAATRYVWGSFLLGRIYLGASGPQFVPPRTARWFADDLEQTDPAVFVEEVDNPVPPDSLVGAVVAADFTPVYSGPTVRVYLRRELATELVTPAADGVTWTPDGDVAGGWELEGGTLSSPSVPDDQPLLSGVCQRLDGVMAGTPGAETRFVIDDASADFAAGEQPGERQYLSAAGGEGWSSSDAVELERATWSAPSGPVPFSLVVGADSAALVIDGEVRAAVRTWGDVRVAVRAPATLEDLTVAPVTLGEACPD